MVLMHMLYICAEDGKRMELVQGKYGLFYRCPGYHQPDETGGLSGKPCYGRLALGAAELIEQVAIKLQEKGRLDAFCSNGSVLHLAKCDVQLRKLSNELCEAVIKRKKKGGRRSGKEC